MQFSKLLGAVAIALGLAAGSASAASLVGEDVTGELNFGAIPLNFFDPGNGFVPAGPLNNAGTTVTIGLADIEFGYLDGFSGFNVDFTDTTLSITQFAVGGGGTANSWAISFVSSAFTGAGLSESSDGFGNGGVSGSILGDTLTFLWGGGSLGSGETTVTYDLKTVAPVPLPAAGLLLVGALGGLGLMRRRKTS